MPLKNIFRLLALVLIITAFYFAVVRNSSLREGPRHHRRRREVGPLDGEARRKWPQSSGKRDRDAQSAAGLEANSGLSCTSEYLSEWVEPTAGACHTRFKGGFPLPDPRCTPGGINPSVSVAVLRDPRWRTGLLRNCAVSEAQKHIAYRWYNQRKPKINSNQRQVCELDHLVPLELGGADGMGNIWPQCGPLAVALNERYFKQKDCVENYLAEEVKSGRMPLAAAQHGIASDWTQYLGAAENWCQNSVR